jgi:hypothetical protein
LRASPGPARGHVLEREGDEPLRDAVLGQDEVAPGEVANQAAVAVPDDAVDDDEARLDLEGGAALLRRGRATARRSPLARRPDRGQRAERQRENRQGDRPAQPPGHLRLGFVQNRSWFLPPRGGFHPS